MTGLGHRRLIDGVAGQSFQSRSARVIRGERIKMVAPILETYTLDKLSQRQICRFFMNCDLPDFLLRKDLIQFETRPDISKVH